MHVVWRRLMSAVLLLAFGINKMVSSVGAVKECRKVGQCRYSTENGEVDLRRLAGSANKPRFNISDARSKLEFYLWNPCMNWFQHNTSSMVDKNECHNVSLCMVQVYPDIGTWYKKLGDQRNSDFALDSATGQCSLVYRTVVGNSTRNTSIILSCDPSVDGRVEPMRTVFVNTYNTVLHTKLACQGLAPSPSPLGWNAGNIVGIVVGVVVFISLVMFLVAYKLGKVHNQNGTLGNNVKTGCFRLFCFWKNSDYAPLN